MFADPAKLRWLEQLLHPEVRERFRQELAQRAEATAEELLSAMVRPLAVTPGA